MLWREFIFSEKRSHHLLRHSVFWLACWLYFSYCDFLYQHPIRGVNLRPTYVTLGEHILLKTLLLIPVYAIAAYVFTYVVLRWLLKRNWEKVSASILLLSAFLLVLGYCMYWYVFPFVDFVFGLYKPNHFVTRFWPAVYIGLVNPIKVVAAAGTIKYLKYWWLKQKESEQLEKEKVNAELQLLKAQIHPDFLFNTLNSIYDHALSRSPQTSEMLLRLSDLLSYILYDCDASMVSLEKEIEMMKRYMEFETLRHNKNVEVEVSVKGNLANHQIAPFLLLPYIENSFKNCSQMTEQSWINMNVAVDGDMFCMKLTNGTSQELLEQAFFSTASLENIGKRLALLYPGEHELKIMSEQEMFIVILSIRLNRTATNPSEEFVKIKTANSQQSQQTILNYASE
jgi:hypothetical protein